MEERLMKVLLSSLSALGLSTLSGCYVVPLEGSYPPPYGHTVQAAPGYVPVVAPQPVPSALQARLYPLNETAGKMGALVATIADDANGHATLTLNNAGEVLHGEATRVPADYAGFGKVHAEVYGNRMMPSGQRGIASAAGARGTYVNCEYALTASNRGTGACLFSNGAKFQLHFGA
jgi:hypothetical protein